jgi:hypothetical protein
MQLFNKPGGLRAAGFGMLLIIVLFSCEVTFDEPLLSYVEAVASGKTLLVSVNDAAFTHDGDAFDLGALAVGETSEVNTITIENIGQIDLVVNTIVIDLEGFGGSPFSIDTSMITLPLTLLPGESSTFTVVFHPTLEVHDDGLLSGNIIIGSSDTEFSNFKLNLIGICTTVTAPNIAVTESDGTVYSDNGVSCDFGITDDLTRTFTITNSGTGTLVISSIISTNNTVFNINTSNTSFSLAEGEETTFIVTYNNSIDSSRIAATIIIVSDSIQETDFDINVFAGGENIELTISPDSGYRLDGHGYNFAYQSSTVNQVLSFTNNEVFNVEIVSSTVLASDFISSDMGVVTIPVGTSGTHAVSYNPGATATSSQKANLILTDEMGRTYSVLLLGTNLEQPDHFSLVADLALWLDAENIRSEDTETLGSDIYVNTFRDNSGRSEDLDAIASSSPNDRRPLYIISDDEDALKYNDLNGHPALRFDGLNDYMLVDPSIDQYIYNNGTAYTGTETTLFIVFTQNSNNQYNRYPLSGSTVTPYFPRLYLYSNKSFRVYGYNDWHISEAAQYWDYGYSYLWTLEKNLLPSVGSNTLRVWIDNILAPNSDATDVVYTNQWYNYRLADMTIGALYNATAFFGGDIAEIIIYDRVLSDTERNYIHDYLNDKYDLW